ncbi:protein outspread isoform X2 [Euwallacea fornicatus]|uniref:protein outspread isoform X2 n=1 Tax=Euwallacea fornicatus TaxID=995702 RepID=UPI00338E54E5
MSQCKKFTPNIFHKSKCSNCFRQKEEHSAEALECNRASRSIARSGYLFVAPDWDFSVPLNRTKRWQRRWFVLYDDGELNYSVDEHPDTIPQGSVDMSKVLEVTGAEQVTGHPHSLALTSPDRVTFVKAASREDARWWAELLAVFPRRHKRNATFPGGRASPSLPQLGRSASPQPPRPRHLSVTGASPRANFETPPLKEERESPPKDGERGAVNIEVEDRRGLTESDSGRQHLRPAWIPERSPGVIIENAAPLIRKDYVVSSGSPPTRDKLRCDDKARARRDWRNERLRDIATALTDRSPESSLALPAEGLLHLKKGWLWLKTQDKEGVRRWIVLCGPTLNVYQDQDEHGVPEICVELSTVTNYTEVPTDSKYGFEIQWSGPTLTLSAVTQGIRSNWMQALKKAAPMPAESSIIPNTLKSILFSSDEEYRTASEGGRRESGDWSELPPSPPLNRLALRVKDRARVRPRPPRCQSRQSTLDSTSTDELDCAKDPMDTSLEMPSVPNGNELISDLQKQLAWSAQEVNKLEEEIARLKKLQSDAAIREKKAKDMLASLEKVEQELNQRNSQMEIKFLKEQKTLQRRLAESEQMSRTFEEKYEMLLRELQAKQQILCNLQEELDSSNERLERSRQDNDRVYKKLQELESRCYLKNSMPVDSLTDLTNIDLEVDIDELGTNELKEYCLDLKCRFEKAVIEIRALKRALRSSEDNCDRLEIANHSLKQSIELLKQEHQAEINLLVARLDHLTSKLTMVEKQLRLKAKSEAKDKRRSLSLKGRESFSINKEVEDKVTELEAKIIALEKGKPKRRFKRERSSERTSPIDDKSLRRLRRKSLDSATSSEPIKLLMRLSSLESKVSSVNASNESLNIIRSSSVSDLSKLTEESETPDSSKFDIDSLLLSARTKVMECLHSVNVLKNRRSSLSSERLLFLESTLSELGDILAKGDSMNSNLNSDEAHVVNASAENVVKQLQQILLEKLTNLAEKKRQLLESGKLDTNARLQILAEKVSFENILVDRIQGALESPFTGEAICKRLIDKETKETAYLIISLQNKLNGTGQKHPPVCRTSAEYLSRVLAKCLVAVGQGFKMCKNFVKKNGPSLHILCEEQRKLEVLLDVYKATKLPQLAEALAHEAYNMSSDKSCRIRSLSQDTVEDFNKTATEIVNAELIQSEINHVLLRAAQIYQSNLETDHSFFFSFFASERAALELWSDSVGDCLYDEINKSVSELTDLYRNCLNKLQRQNWRRRVESERFSRTSAHLLHEFADIIAHKALIDARINVLSGKCNISQDLPCDETVNSMSTWLESEKYWIRLKNQPMVQVDQSLEAEFACMLERFGDECVARVGQPELKQIIQHLEEFQSKVDELQRIAKVPKDSSDVVVRNWNDVCQKCKKLRSNLENIKCSIEKSGSLSRFDSQLDQRPVYLGTEYLTQVENLRAAYRCALASCKERHQESDIEQLHQLCEKVLSSIEQWHRRTIQDLREAHAQEVEMLRQEKEQALAEETQATLAALDAMRKAHVAEVQREVARFKQEFARQQRDEILDLSERLSVKSLEAAALEEQLGSTTRQLAHAQQHILRLERNPQLSPMQVRIDLPKLNRCMSSTCVN